MKKKLNIGRFLRGLSFAVLITSLLSLCVVGVFARYTSTMTGTLSLRVAKWDVKLLDVENPTTKMDFNSSGESVTTETVGYVFSIESKSEVAVEYSVKLTFNNAPPANVHLWIDDESKAISCNGEQTEFIFSGYEYAIGNGAKTHTLYVAVDYVKDDKLIDFNTFRDTVSVNIIAEQKAPTK